MMKNISKYLLCAFLCAGVSASAEIPMSYYSSLDGLSGSELKTAVHHLVRNSLDALPYGPGAGHTWYGFYITDRRPDNSVVDRYSDEVFYFTSQGNSVPGMNIEHSFPKSWWGGDENDAYCDLYNLMPAETKINMLKSNYPMGTVAMLDDAMGNDVTLVGTGADGRTYWEPADCWKGDFARGYMYMATAYQDLEWNNYQGKIILESGDYPTLKPAASRRFIRWAANDDVDNLEATRNGNVSSLQGNRNPFIDFPNLMHYVWGDSVGVAFDIHKTRKADNVAGGVTTVYSSTFLGETGGCTVSTSYNPDNISNIWSNSASYGWTAKGSTGGGSSVVCHPTDSRLVTPEIDLTGFDKARMAFDHACKFAANPSGVLSVLAILPDGTESDLAVGCWPTGSDWVFVNSRAIDLTPFAGKKIRIAFRYTSTASEACTWEIKNLAVTAEAAGTPAPAIISNTLFAATFLNGDDGDCRVTSEVKPDAIDNIWSMSDTYGWTAKASKSEGSSVARYESVSTMMTPWFNIPEGSDAVMNFEHACKFAANPRNVLGVMVEDAGGNVTELSGFAWPGGTNWNYTNTGNIDLGGFAGKRVRILFRYTSTTSEACTWEIKNLAVTQTHFSSIAVPSVDGSTDAPVEYYSIDGYRIVNPADYRGILIRRQGTKATKILRACSLIFVNAEAVRR